MNRALLVRAAGLYVPLVLAVALFLWRRPGRRDRAALLLSAAWNLPALLLLHALAQRFGWWRFEAQGGLFSGFPVDLYIGWAILWGPVAALAFPRLRLAGLLILAAAVDLVLMPAARPVIVLGDTWLIGEGVGLLVALMPAQLLARWTSQDWRLPARAALQVAGFAGLLLGVLPVAILQQTGGSLETFLSRPPWEASLLLQLLLLAAVPGLSAVQEFCERGGGTPLPYDPPRRLVRSGVYAYVANPMQVSMCLVLFGLGVALGSLAVAGAGAMSFAYGAGMASWHEDEGARRRFGEAWDEYRSNVRRWWPRWRPWIPEAARLYVAEGCGPCSQIGSWLRRRNPFALEIRAAEKHPTRDLLRLTYEPARGNCEDGVAAFARALEHIHLGWAFVGWTARLPLIQPLLQIVLDASGGGPRPVGRNVSHPAHAETELRP